MAVKHESIKPDLFFPAIQNVFEHFMLWNKVPALQGPSSLSHQSLYNTRYFTVFVEPFGRFFKQMSKAQDSDHSGDSLPF